MPAVGMTTATPTATPRQRRQRMPEPVMDWQEVNPASDTPATASTFTGCPGARLALQSDAAPVAYFTQFFDTEVIDMIVRETNRYAKPLQKNHT